MPRTHLHIASCLFVLSALVGCGSDEEDDAAAGAGASSSAGNTGSGAASSSGAGGDASGSGGQGATGGGGAAGSGGSGGGGSAMNFFVTSDTSPDGNFGGLAGADARCQMLAEAAGEGAKTWRAYLSTEQPPTNARDRIGEGPYYNAAGVVVAADKAALHDMLAGNADLFLTETGDKVNGQWDQSPDPNQHDIMTGTTADGLVDAGATCADWTSDTGSVRVGHSDGLGPGGSDEPQYVSWNSSHDGQCGDPEATGGAGKIYCFVGP
jgi:hypothetical protein